MSGQSIMYMKYLFSKLEETNLRFTKKATFYLFKAEAYICMYLISTWTLTYRRQM